MPRMIGVACVAWIFAESCWLYDSYGASTIRWLAWDVVYRHLDTIGVFAVVAVLLPLVYNRLRRRRRLIVVANVTLRRLLTTGIYGSTALLVATIYWLYMGQPNAIEMSSLILRPVSANSLRLVPSTEVHYQELAPIPDHVAASDLAGVLRDIGQNFWQPADVSLIKPMSLAQAAVNFGVTTGTLAISRPDSTVELVKRTEGLRGDIGLSSDVQERLLSQDYWVDLCRPYAAWLPGSGPVTIVPKISYVRNGNVEASVWGGDFLVHDNGWIEDLSVKQATHDERLRYLVLYPRELAQDAAGHQPQLLVTTDGASWVAIAPYGFFSSDHVDLLVFNGHSGQLSVQRMKS